VLVYLKKTITNGFTLSNLFLGFVSIVLLSISINSDKYDYINLACYLILIASLIDSFDGKLARKLGISSDFGREIDSLADLISFCLAPSFLLFVYYYNLELIQLKTLIFLSSFPLILGAIRLAKYNSLSNMRDSSKYIGLPTPANAILICSSILYVNRYIYRELSSFMEYSNFNYMIFEWMNFPLQNIFIREFTIIVIAIISSFLLMSKVDYEKFPLISFQINKKNTLDLIGLILFFLIFIASIISKNYDIVLLFFMMIYIYGNLIKFFFSQLKSKIKSNHL